MINNIDNIGVIIDCSRNAVFKIETLKPFAKRLSVLGYKTIQLYTEDTFRVDSQPYFGYLRGRYTEDELNDFITYCETIGIEVIPCIQTLAHFSCSLLLPCYDSIRDLDDILLVDEDKTYSFLEDIFKSVRKIFKSNRINIGFDEASMVGLGKYLKRFGYQDKKNIMQKHLSKVVAIAKKYNFTPMMWSDMLFDIDENGRQYVVREEALFSLPGEVRLLYWDYYHKEKTYYDKMCKIHKRLNRSISFAGGAWTWTGFAPNNKYAIRTFEHAISACKENDIDEAFITIWGDDGAECPLSSTYPALYYFAKLSQGKNIDKQEFRDIFNIPIDDCFAIDDINYIGKVLFDAQNPSKYMLYNDLFLGKFDCTVEKNDSFQFYGLFKKYKNLKIKNKEYYALFDMYEKLSKTLTVKCDLGLKLRETYKCKNKAKLKLLLKEIKKTENYLKEFKSSFERVWMSEKKPFGYEVQESRLSGLIGRINYCKRKLDSFIKGKINSIEELEEKVLEFDGSGEFVQGKKIVFNQFNENFTTGRY